jgi:hypothetical protein
LRKARAHRKTKKPENAFARAKAQWGHWRRFAEAQLEDRRAAVASFLGGFLALGGIVFFWPSRTLNFSAAETLGTPTHAEMLADPLQQDPWEFFHAVWRDDDSWFSLPTSSDERTGLKDYMTELRHLVTDPRGKIEPEFRVPEFLKDRVVFWMLIHSRYSRKIRVIHDRNDPGIVYGYLDLRPLHRALGATGTFEKRAAAAEKAVLKGLRERLLEAGGIGTSRILLPKEKEQLHVFLSKHGALGKERIASLCASIRTQTGQSDEFLAALNRSRSLLPHIESVMRQKGLPVALARIPFVESSFNEVAHSKVGAMGIWQFMPATAQELIHKTDRDLWSDPISQTKGATRMFTMYRSVLPDWGTTVTSYNSGVGRVRRMLEKHKLKGIDGLLQLSERDGLGFAGQNFFAQFLSANLVEAYKEDLFLSTIPSNEMASVLGGISPFAKEVCDVQR